MPWLADPGGRIIDGWHWSERSLARKFNENVEPGFRPGMFQPRLS